MDQLADLVARITDIESCLVSAYKKEVDQSQILEMSEEMSKIENNLDQIEAEVRSQMLLIGQVDDMISHIKSIRNCCNALPKIDDSDEIKEEQISQPIEKPQTSRIPVPAETKVKTEVHYKKEAVQPKKQDVSGVPSRDKYIINISDSEKFVKQGGYRIKTAEINLCIDEINSVLAQKYRILNARKNDVDRKYLDLWKRYKDEGDFKSPFFTDTDIENIPTIKKNRNVLIVLKAMGLIYENNNNKKIRMYVVKGFE